MFPLQRNSDIIKRTLPPTILRDAFRYEGDGNDDDDDAEVLDEDELLTKFRRTLVIPDDSFDHVVLGTSDVERSIEDFEKMTGVRPVYVISLNGLGTKSARGMYPCTFQLY